MKTDGITNDTPEDKQKSVLHTIPTDLLSNLIFQMSPDLICTVGKDGFFVELNLSWEKTLGYTLAELKSKPFTDFLHPDDLELTIQEFSEELEGKDVFNFINRYRHKDGSYRWFDWRGKATPDRSFAFAVARDITEEVKTRELLSRSEEKYRLLFQNMDDGWALCDVSVNDGGEVADLHFLEYNKVFLTITRTTADELAAKTFRQIFSDDERTRTIRYGQVGLTGIPCTEEFFSGLFQKYFRVHVYSPQQAQVVIILEDITERKKTEQQLIRVQAAVESSSNAIAIADHLGNHVYHNRAFKALYGFDNTEEVRAAGGGRTRVKDPAIAEEIFDCILSGRSWTGELEMVRRDGSTFHAHEIADSIKDEEGNIIGVMGIITDITLRRSEEDKLRQSEAKFRTLTENSGDIILRIDSGYNCVYANPVAEKVLNLYKDASSGHFRLIH